MKLAKGIAKAGGPKLGLSRADRGGRKWLPLLEQARSVWLQASSPSAQVKTAAAQVGDRNWNWRGKISCPTIRVCSRNTNKGEKRLPSNGKETHEECLASSLTGCRCSSLVLSQLRCVQLSPLARQAHALSLQSTGYQNVSTRLGILSAERDPCW
jgi:hypothetical protein